MTQRTAREMTPSDLGLGVLSQLVDSAMDGIAVIDRASGRFRYVNPAGCRMLGGALTELVGSPAEMFRPEAGSSTSEAPAPDDRAAMQFGSREFEYMTADVATSGTPLWVVRFRDVTEARRQERRLKAFGQTSAGIAFAARLTTVLDRLAADVRAATGMVACTFLLMDRDGDLRQAGTSGDYPGVDDYAERLKACRALGARLLSTEAFESRRTLVVEGWRQRTLGDPRFAPLHDISRRASWHTIAVVPLVARGQVAGVFNGYYLEGHAPGDSEIAFLTAIADQAAVAVDNARLVRELESKVALEERHRLARDLHDSVRQALFSLSLRTRAVELALDVPDPDIPSALAGLADLRGLARAALAEMRALIFQLRPDALHEEGLVSALRRHAAAVEGREDLRVLVAGPEDDLMLAETTESELFMVAQEALNNVVRHAHAASVFIRVEITGSDLVLEVEDTGCGFDSTADHRGNLGLRSMAERVAGLGGALTVRSSPGTATTVRAVVPIAPRKRDAQDGGGLP